MNLKLKTLAHQAKTHSCIFQRIEHQFRQGALPDLQAMTQAADLMAYHLQQMIWVIDLMEAEARGQVLKLADLDRGPDYLQGQASFEEPRRKPTA